MDRRAAPMAASDPSVAMTMFMGSSIDGRVYYRAQHYASDLHHFRAGALSAARPNALGGGLVGPDCVRSSYPGFELPLGRWGRPLEGVGSGTPLRRPVEIAPIMDGSGDGGLPAGNPIGTG